MLRFGSFELDPAAGELRREGAPQKLQPQPFKVLYLLASRAGEIVTRDQVRAAVWGEGTHVDFDQGLGFCLSQIRSALGDSAQDPRFVQTLPRRGYRFLQEVEAVSRAGGAVRATPGTRRLPLRVATLAALMTLGLALALRSPAPGAAQRAEVRLAVLPFEDLSGAPGDVPVGDAFAEEIISEVGRLNPRRLSVIARSSAMRFRGAGADLAKLRDDLDVDYALEGSVRVEGDRVRITTRLVRLSDAVQVQVRVYDRRLGDLLSLQRHVAADTARCVRVALTPDAEQRIAETRPVDPEVGHLTLVAGYHTRQRTPEGLKRAASLFEEALERDGNHAPAWAGLAEAMIALADRDLAPRDEALAQAEAAARRSLELDPELAPAHALLGGIAAMRDWDWAAARDHYERSLALGPEATVHRWYAHLLMTLGDVEGALVQMRRAAELDPLSPLVNEQLLFALLLDARYAEAYEQADRFERLSPEAGDVQLARGMALLGLGRPGEALEVIEAAGVEMDSRDCDLTRARALEALGRKDEAREALEALLPPLGDDGHAFLRARVLAALGRRAPALEALAAAIADRDPKARWLAITQEFEALEDSPRYRALRRALGIEARAG